VHEYDPSVYRDVEIHGDERSEALRRIAEQVDRWGAALPETRPLMLHFGLGEFYTTGETEYWLANEEAAGYCAKLMFVFEGQTCPYHHHRTKHETFYVLQGTTQMVIRGAMHTYRAGDVVTIPPGTPHSFVGKNGAALLLEVSMPSVPGDSYFADQRIGTNGII
jgi:mannose-6-phosphate isomerase-like protein (cupin superfamily)